MMKPSLASRLIDCVGVRPTSAVFPIICAVTAKKRLNRYSPANSDDDTSASVSGMGSPPRCSELLNKFTAHAPMSSSGVIPMVAEHSHAKAC